MEIHGYPVQIDRFCVQSTTGVELMRERVPKSMATFVLLSVTSEEGVQKMVSVGCAQQPLSWWGNPAPKCLIGSPLCTAPNCTRVSIFKTFPPKKSDTQYGVFRDCLFMHLSLMGRGMPCCFPKAQFLLLQCAGNYISHKH